MVKDLHTFQESVGKLSFDKKSMICHAKKMPQKYDKEAIEGEISSQLVFEFCNVFDQK